MLAIQAIGDHQVAADHVLHVAPTVLHVVPVVTQAVLHVPVALLMVRVSHVPLNVLHVLAIPTAFQANVVPTVVPVVVTVAPTVVQAAVQAVPQVPVIKKSETKVSNYFFIFNIRKITHLM